MRQKKWLLAALPAAILSACTADTAAPMSEDSVWPQLDIPVAQKPAMEQRIDDITRRDDARAKSRTDDPA